MGPGMRKLLLSLTVLTFTPLALAAVMESSPMGFSMAFTKGAKPSEVIAMQERYGVVTIDASPFGDRASQVCEWLVTPPNGIHGTNYVYGWLENGRLLVKPEIEWQGRTIAGEVWVHLGFFEKLELRPSGTRPDSWETLLLFPYPSLSDKHFQPRGLLAKLQKSFFDSLVYLEDGRSGSQRVLTVKGKLRSPSDFDVEAMAARLNFNRIAGNSVGTQDLVIAHGELSKGPRGYRVTTASGAEYRIKVIDSPLFAGQSGGLNLDQMLHQSVLVQGLEGETLGLLEIYPGADQNTFVKLSSSFGQE